MLEEEIIPKAIRERLGIQTAFAAEAAKISIENQRQFVAVRMPKMAEGKQDRNFVISTGSVSPDSIIRFVKDAFQLLGGRLIVIYDKEADRLEIKKALKNTDFDSRVAYHKTNGDLKTALLKAYREFRGESAVVVAPSGNFDQAIRAHQRLIFDSILVQAGTAALEELVLAEIAVPLAGISPDSKAEEIEQELTRLLSVWSQRGFEGVQFDGRGVAPDLGRFLRFITSQFEGQAKASA